MRLVDLRSALATAPAAKEACAAACEFLAGIPDYKPSVYLERGGRLRCQAARTYLQVLDGMPSGAGLIGRTFASGEPTFTSHVGHEPGYLEITPGVRAEICIPVRCGARVVGVISVESLAVLDEGAGLQVAACAELLGDRLQELGGGLHETPVQRLARHAVGLRGMHLASAIEAHILAAACDVAGMDSAVLLVASGDGTAVCTATGPLAGAITGADDHTSATLAALTSAGASCFTVGDDGGQDFDGLAALRNVGVGCLIVMPLGFERRILVVADRTAHEISTDTVELLELLCAHADSALRVAGLVADLERQAATDPLTGLGHHGHFQDRLHARAGDERLAVVMLDLDDFKLVNDTGGHPAGDRLLCEVAAALEGSLRGGDELFRIGGDEFAALARVPGEPEARELAHRLVEAVRAVTGATVSAGVSLADPLEPRMATLARADRALYDAKAGGRDTAVLA